MCFHQTSSISIEEISEEKWVIKLEKVGECNISNFSYVDDTTIISDSKEKLQHLFNIIAKENKEKGLCIYIKKTEHMIISKRKTSSTCKIYIHGKRIREVESFYCLGSTVTSLGKCDEDIKEKVALAKDSFTKISNILKSGKLSMETKLRFLSCCMFSILAYGNQCGTISRSMEKRFKAAELWYYQMMLHISWMDHISNKEVLRKIRRNRLLLFAIRMCQLNFWAISSER